MLLIGEWGRGLGRAVGGSRIVHRCFRTPRRSRIRGYHSSTCPFAVSRSWKGWTPFRTTGWFVMAKHRRLSAARRRPSAVIAGYCRCSTGAAGLPRQRHGEPLSLAPRQRCAGPRRGAVRHPAPAHSTRCRDLTRSKAAPSTSSTRCLRWCASRWLRVPSGGVRDRQVVGQLEPYRAAGLLESGGPRRHVGDIRGANAVELDIVHAPRREFVRPGADVVMRRDCCS